MSLTESKGHVSTVSVICPPRKSAQPALTTRERKTGGDARPSLSSASAATPSIPKIGEASDESDSSDADESGSLESFLMTVLKKSSTHSSTVRSQAKLLFKEGVFTLSDLDQLLLDLKSEKWSRLSSSLDKRVVLACKTRAKVAATSQ